jgi:hypothetical protein
MLLRSSSAQAVETIQPYKVNDKPGDETGIVGYHERRILTVRDWKEYDFPVLDFLGWWNNSRFGAAEGKMFAEHFGVHFHERNKRVRLPFSLVDELKNYWTEKPRDGKMQNYALCVSRSRAIVSELAITAEQEYEANLYAPALAFVLSWDSQQNVSRFCTGSYVHAGPVVEKNVQALNTRVGLVLTFTVASSILLASTAFLYWRACKYPLFQPDLVRWKRLLVGVELNPGPCQCTGCFWYGWWCKSDYRLLQQRNRRMVALGLIPPSLPPQVAKVVAFPQPTDVVPIRARL